jgi:hypothetical protein
MYKINIKGMNRMSEVKSAGPIETLQKEANAIATAFTLIANSQHLGNQADSVLVALKYLDERHSEKVKELESLMPAPETSKEVIDTSVVEVK